jgi:hypothetical protein
LRLISMVCRKICGVSGPSPTDVDLGRYLSPEGIRRTSCMPFTVDPFLDQFTKLFATIVGATILAGLLWRFNYARSKRKRREAWEEEEAVGENS